MRPDARIIAILREPASFLRSLHLQFLQVYVETENDFAQGDRAGGGRGVAAGTYPATPTGRSSLLYSEHVRYVEQLRRFHAVFAPEQVLVLIYDDFRGENEATVRRVLRFLEVDDAVPIELVEANPTVLARSQLLNELVHAVAVGRGPVSLAVKASIKALTPSAAASQRAARGAAPARLRRARHLKTRRSMLELRRRFKAEVSALSEYLGRDLVSLWGYDGVGYDSVEL